MNDLFNEHAQRLEDYLESRSTSIHNGIYAQEEYIVLDQQEDLLKNIKTQYTIEAPRIDESSIEISPTTGYVKFYVPFTGNREVLQMQPNALSPNPPQGTIVRSEIIMVYSLEMDAEKIQQEFEKNLDRLKKHLAQLKEQIMPYNSGITEIASEAIKARRKGIQEYWDKINKINYPIRKER